MSDKKKTNHVIEVVKELKKKLLVYLVYILYDTEEVLADNRVWNSTVFTDSTSSLTVF